MKFLFVLALIFAVCSANLQQDVDRLVDYSDLYLNLTLPSKSICSSAASKASHYASCGCPYVWGGTSCGCGGSGGMDCSGIVYTSFREAGWSGITRVTTTQFQQGVKCSSCSPSNPGACQPGDLIFYCFSGSNCPDHVTMAIGGSKAVECPEPGQDCHIITPYAENYYGCRSMC
ncbi:hypothetical protein DICPUDRAFT_28130 [Dictyostelium purpureum]|uniref:NlpC/P60 domain-containing protein n=1 Tax=Dictyostelium purpureum TaxID=5786 RepID=F0ZBD5_DICPU|nr:uncharacterized protein DICPUDRAFT_28130 [Dictyostelium purpureum]EGC38754.1 hypothetical protein DICPUDRAFT_28130 [Dictyostelium purpureum]|eukprot:XP_003284745.1 hypothetical protein DICPUDRAFT_28130 [Dictyostelium purpureum]